MQAVTFELPIERAAADPKQTGSDSLVAANLLQRPNDVFALDLDERRWIAIAALRDRQSAGSGSRRRNPLLPHTACEISFGHELAVGENAGALDHVSKLPDVPVPACVRQQTLGARSEPDERLVEPLREPAYEC